MNTEEEIFFEEKQFLGHNRFSIIVRTLLAIFCFVGYYWSENPNPVQVSFIKIGSYPISHLSHSGLMFFIFGLTILLFSVLLTYVLHIHTKVYRGYIILDGFWTARKVKIDLNNIIHVRKSRYKKNALRRAVYNLHNKGIIRFYSSGEDFVELTDKSGFSYRIGSQKPLELYRVINTELKFIKN